MKLSTWISFFFCSILIIKFFVAQTHMPLFADGAYFFISIIEEFSRTGAWSIKDNGDNPSLFINAINQVFINLGLLWGEQDLSILAILFSLPLLILPTLTVFRFTVFANANSALQSSIQFCALGSFSLLCLNSEVFSLNPALLAISLSWAYLFFLANPNPTKQDAITLIAIGCVLFRAHELTLITGISATALGFILYKRHHKIYHLLFATLSATHFIYNLSWVITHDPQNNSVLHLADVFSVINNPAFLSSSFLITLSGVVAIGCQYLHQELRFFKLAALFLPVGVTLALIPFPVETIHPQLESTSRILILVAAATTLLLPFSFLLNFRLPKLTDHTKLGMTVIIFSFSLWQLNNSIYWQSFTQHIEQTLRERTGLIAIESLNIPTPAERFNWGYTWPSLSIIYGPQPLRAMILPRNREIKIETRTIEIPFRSFSKSTDYWKIDL